MSKESKELAVTPEEMAMMREAGCENFYTMGLLHQVRTRELTIEEAFISAITEPAVEEHVGHYTAARDFLLEHAEKLGIK